jgi:hypothetical protein
VLNKDLDLRVHFTLQVSVNNLIFSSGMVGVVSHNNIIFMNLLGGNQVLLQCLNHNTILDAIHDSVNNYLYLVDTSGYLLIYNTKLTLARPSNNECDIIYKVKLVNSSVKASKMHIFRNILYMILDNKFIGIIDLSLLDKSGLVVNRFYLNSKLFNNNLDLDYSIMPLHPGKDSLLALKVSNYDIILTRVIHHDTNIAAKTEKSLLTHVEENIVYVYGVVVLIVIYMVIMMKKGNDGKKPQIPDLKDKGDDEPLTVEDHKLIEEMFRKIRGVKDTGIPEDLGEDAYGDEEEDLDDIDAQGNNEDE